MLHSNPKGFYQILCMIFKSKLNDTFLAKKEEGNKKGNDSSKFHQSETNTLRRKVDADVGHDLLRQRLILDFLHPNQIALILYFRL